MSHKLWIKISDLLLSAKSAAVISFILFYFVMAYWCSIGVVFGVVLLVYSEKNVDSRILGRPCAIDSKFDKESGDLKNLEISFLYSW